MFSGKIQIRIVIERSLLSHVSLNAKINEYHDEARQQLARECSKMKIDLNVMARRNKKVENFCARNMKLLDRRCATQIYNNALKMDST